MTGGMQRFIAAGKAHTTHKPAGRMGVRITTIAKRDRNLCHLCGRKVLPSEASRDHIVPRSEGGSDAASNLALAHRKCNNDRRSEPTDTRVTVRGWRKPSKHPAKARQR